MTWEQKLKALTGLSEIHVGLNAYGAFYAALSNCEVGDNGILGSMSGHGDTMEEAVNQLWAYFAECDRNKYVVKGAYTDNRRHYKWNGFMWEERPVPQKVER